MSTYLLHLDEKDLDAIVQAKVDAAMQKLTAQLEAEKKLPMQLSCIEAAAVIGICVRKFHRDCKHLKRRGDKGGVYVLSADAVKYRNGLSWK